MTDREILRSIYSDDVSGMRLLIEVYADLVYEIVSEILSEVGTFEDAQECVSEAFIAFCYNIDDVDLSRGSIAGFLGVIARRRAVNLRCTLCHDEDISFDEYTVEEMSSMLDDFEVREYEGLIDIITRQCLKEIDPDAIATETESAREEAESFDEAEAFDEAEVFEEEADSFKEETEDFQEETENEDVNHKEKKKSKKSGRVLKSFVATVVIVSVAMAGLMLYDKFRVPEYVPPATQEATQSGSFNPIFSAITQGNEKLIEQLITNSLLLSQDVLKFAVESADKISYDSIRRIAEEVREKYGSTGLDPLLERAIFGDFEAVEEELKNKDESQMTPTEKLALFFITTFGNN